MPVWVSVIAVTAVGASQRWAVVALHSLLLRLSGQRRRAQVLLWIMLFPGVVLHEGSHWVVAKLLGVPCGKIRLFALGKGGGSSVRLGYLEVARVDPLRNALVALAPPVVGLAAVYLVASMVGLLPGALNLPNLIAELWSVLLKPWGWKDVGALYLIFAISAAAVPSQSDLSPSRWVVIVAVSVVAAAEALGWMRALPLGLGGTIYLLAFRVATCAMVCVLVNVVVGLAAGTLDVIATLLLPRRVRA
jgi:hypothetical protein